MSRSSLRQKIGNIPIPELAREFGTPIYLYETTSIERRIAELDDFDVVRYAQKANSNLAILNFLKEHGALVDTVSAGEIHRALAAGYSADGDPPSIVYTADIFDDETLELVVERGIHVNCGSPDMIDQYGEHVSSGEITLRINPGFGHGHSQKTNTGGDQSKHGIWHEQLGDCLGRADRNQLTITGVHVHIGSGTDLAHLSKVCGALERIAESIGPSITSISAGGGLPIPYRNDDPEIDISAYYELWNETRNRLASRFDHAVRLEIEPGRFLVAESGYLLSQIRAIKTMGSNIFYLVNAGFNDLARPILYGAYHPIAIATCDGRTPHNFNEVVVGGPLCESGDIFTQKEGGYVRTERLPEARVGDYLVIECAGAYCATMSSNYNSRPLAAEILVHEGTAQVVRKRQEAQELFSSETIPLITGKTSYGN